MACVVSSFLMDSVAKSYCAVGRTLVSNFKVAGLDPLKGDF